MACFSALPLPLDLNEVSRLKGKSRTDDRQRLPLIAGPLGLEWHMWLGRGGEVCGEESELHFLPPGCRTWTG